MGNLVGDSAIANVPAVTGTNNAPGANVSTAGRGVEGNSDSGVGVLGQSKSGVTVFGNSTDGPGVFGHSENAEGVHGETNSLVSPGVAGFGLKGGTGVFGHCSNGLAMHAVADQGIALLAEAKGPAGSIAGQFNGDVVVTGDVILQNADCAEDFDIAGLEGAEPGSVMVIGHDNALRQSEQAYDKRAAGVVSGAGDFKPGIVLDRREPVQSRKSIALLGKVYCKADASRAPIEVGDLLTTSPTPGHAMKATDPVRAFGAVIGKALRPLRGGQGLIPILVALQ
jgi:hypothetical protein